MGSDLSVTNGWLAVIAIVSVIEMIVVIGALVMGWRLYARVAALADVAQREAGPLIARTHAALDQVDEIVARVRRFDEDTRHAADQVRTGVGKVVRFARIGLDPVARLAHIAGVAFRAFRSPPPRPMPDRGPMPANDDDDEERFVYEGGGQQRPRWRA